MNIKTGDMFTWERKFNVFKEDNDNLYLYNSSVSAYILPKRE